MFRSDSPKYYKEKGKFFQAKQVNELIYGKELHDGTEENENSEDTIAPTVEHEVTVSDMFKPNYFKAFWIGCVLSIVQ